MAEKKPIAKEVSISAEKLIADFAEMVANLGGKTTDYEIENKLDVPLHRWSYVGGFTPSSDSHGSGTYPDGAPVKKIDATYEGLTAYESAGAGAIALMIYQVGDSDIYVVCYAGNPDVGTSTASARILFAPSWKLLKSSMRQDIANEIIFCLNNVTTETSGSIEGCGIDVTYDFTGSHDMTAKFTIEERKNNIQSFAIKSKKYDKYIVGRLKYNGPCLDGWVLGTNQELHLNTSDYASIFEFGKEGSQPYHHIVKASGQEGKLYLNYRGIGGELKIYDEEDTSEWSIYNTSGIKKEKTVPIGSVYIHSLDHEAWLRADDDGDCYVDVDKGDHKKNSACVWTCEVVSYK